MVWFMADMTVKEMASKGGLARAVKLSPRRRKQIARTAAVARWDKAAIVPNKP